MTNLVALDKDKDSVGSLALKDFMISFDKLGRVDNSSSHLEIYLMNLRSSLVEHKEEVAEAHVVARLDKEERIL